jgi:outer membrane protein insertion porin family
VLAFYARACVVDSYADDEIPIGSRYFLGGGRTVRGFRHRAIGPKALPDDDPASTSYHPIGGQTKLEATVEYTIPVFKFLRMAAFYDVGNVWADPYDFDFGEYASSVGGGLRLDIPGFPMRIDYASALEKDDDLTRERSLVFWIGFDD